MCELSESTGGWVGHPCSGLGDVAVVLAHAGGHLAL